MVGAPQDCPICHEFIMFGQDFRSANGKPLFIAECSHVFHFNCIFPSIYNYGNRTCPVCYSTWVNLPYQLLQMPNHPDHYLEFADDELLPIQSQNPIGKNEVRAEGVTVAALPEYPALSESKQSDSFGVMVSIKGPTLSYENESRSPIDLVAVLDASGSMNGPKLRLLKQAVRFVIDNLGPNDRFSIVTFSDNAERVTQLKRMTNDGRSETARAVNSIRVNGGTNIIAGLLKAVKVLEQRRQKNPVTSIILFSDGQDKNCPTDEGFYAALNQLPDCIRSKKLGNSIQSLDNLGHIPVHTFGLGTDHDTRALHEVANGSGGSFSYVGTFDVIQEAFAQCLSGLLNVVAKDVKIQIQSGSAEVGIQSISSGQYQNTIQRNSIPQQGLIEMRNLYAEEEKRFLVYLSVPQESGSSTKLLEVKCSSKDPLSNDDTQTETETKIVEIKRCPPEELTAEDRKMCLEVDIERNKVIIAEGIVQAQAMAERGQYLDACLLLDEKRRNLMSSHSARAKDPSCEWLKNEVIEIREQMRSKSTYIGGGRAYALATENSNVSHRGGVIASPTIASRSAHPHPDMAMRRIVKKVRVCRQPNTQN